MNLAAINNQKNVRNKTYKPSSDPVLGSWSQIFMTEFCAEGASGHGRFPALRRSFCHGCPGEAGFHAPCRKLNEDVLRQQANTTITMIMIIIIN